MTTAVYDTNIPDLLTLKKHEQIAIVTAREFLDFARPVPARLQ